MAAINQRERNNGETGYNWLFFIGGEAWYLRPLVIILGVVAGIVFYVWYIRHSNDASPDSIAGYAYAIIGTLFLLMAAILYSLRHRSHKKRTVGQLHKSLNWHICFGVLGLAFLFLHSFGNFNLRTGTYALYGMIALTLSGMVGRFLDRLVPRLITGEVHKALTVMGDDRIETISQKLQAIVVHNTQDLHSFSVVSGEKSQDASTPLVSSSGPNSSDFSFMHKDQALQTPWDLAYISLEATPQELSLETNHYRFIPDKKSGLVRPGALMPGAQEHISELEEVEHAMQRELFYRYVIRYWRKFHILLALLTLALTLWHLVYAGQLLLPVFLHR
jgi:fumarate reductase subunit D